MESKKFRHIPTGEIVTQVPISRFSEYEEVLEVPITDDHNGYSTPQAVAERVQSSQNAADFIASHFIIGGIKK